MARNIFMDRKTGLYYMRATVDGKRVTKPCKTRRITEARRKLADWETKIWRGEWGLKEQEKNVRFKDLADRYLEWSEVNHRSHKSTESHCRIILQAIGEDVFIQKVSQQDIERHIFDRRKRVSNATVNREISFLKHLYRKANEWGMTQHNPTQKISKLPEQNQRIRYLRDDEAQSLMDACAAGPWYLLPIVQVALNAGLRRGEILALRWPDIDFDNKSIRVAKSKSGKPRNVPMNDILCSLFKGMKREGERIFPVKEIKRAWATALKKAGVEDFRFHDLRHTFASRLVMTNADLVTVSEFLGHHDIRVTMRYAHLSSEHRRQAINRLAAYQQDQNDRKPAKVVKIS